MEVQVPVVAATSLGAPELVAQGVLLASTGWVDPGPIIFRMADGTVLFTLSCPALLCLNISLCWIAEMRASAAFASACTFSVYSGSSSITSPDCPGAATETSAAAAVKACTMSAS